jgi:hypothetical protein
VLFSQFILSSEITFDRQKTYVIKGWTSVYPQSPFSNGKGKGRNGNGSGGKGRRGREGKGGMGRRWVARRGEEERKGR